LSYLTKFISLRMADKPGLQINLAFNIDVLYTYA
jgi:uncharacterized lipoprotein NlpE involved in copper resistance